MQDKIGQYYANRGQECFGTSLANLLIAKFGDKEIASVVRDVLLATPGTFEDGGTIFTEWPDLAEFATGRRYRAQLLTTEVNLDKAHELAGQVMHPARFGFYQARFADNIGMGRIRLSSGYGDGPVILNLQRPEGLGAHAVVKMPDGSFIDNGRITRNIDGYFAIAALEVERSEYD